MRGVTRVSSLINNIIKEVCKLSFQEELEKFGELDISKIAYQSLTTEQINKLTGKINLLPFEYRSLLFFRYCFGNTVYEIDDILETENTEYKLLYVHNMLSRIMGLENSWIDGDSLKLACKLSLTENMRDYNNIEILRQPTYSTNFRRKLKDIKVGRNTKGVTMLILKRVAVFILVCILSLTGALLINADAREVFFDWIIETFPKFSIFIPRYTDNDNIYVELTSFKINYIPKGFELVDIIEGHNMYIYNYATESNRRFDIRLFSSSGKGQSYYDTENIEIEEFLFKESNAYIWQAGEMTYLIWYQDGVQFNIAGNLDRNEVIKIAKNILSIK